MSRTILLLQPQTWLLKSLLFESNLLEISSNGKIT